MKDAGLRIRIQRDLREQFVAVCRSQDKSAAQVLREFMHDYVERHHTKDTGAAWRRKSPQHGKGG
jgi:hypothetical protein